MCYSLTPIMHRHGPLSGYVVNS